MFWRQLAAMRAEPFAAVPDAELLTRYTASRDEAAFEELARRHGGMVWAVCRQLLSDPADAEDAFQAVFLAFVKSSGRIRHANVGAWLHGTAVRGAMKIRRGAVRARQRDRATAKPEATTPPGDWNELLAAVHDEVGRLPEALRTAFVVCDLEGVPQPDAATRLGWKAGTLTGRLSKARKRLLDALTKRGLAPAATLGLLGLSAATTSADVPLKLLVTVLNFPSAAPGTIPATLAALSLEIVPMTLSKVKLLALAAMLTCGLAAGTGTVLVQVADAQAPPVAVPAERGPPAARPPAPDAAPSPLPQRIPQVAETKPPALAEVEYKYLPQPSRAGVSPLFEQMTTAIDEQLRDGWEFAGTFTAQLKDDDYARLMGAPAPPAASRQQASTTLMVFKKPRTPVKSAPVTLTDGEVRAKLSAEAALFYAAMVPPPAADVARCSTAFTVTEVPENGVTVTYTYKPGEVVAPRHLRYAGNNVTAAPAVTVNPPKPEPARTPPPMLTRPETRLDPLFNAAPQVKPIAPQLPPPTVDPSAKLLKPTVNNAVVATGDFQVTTVGSDGAQGTSFYRRGDAVPPHHASFMPKPKDELLPTPVTMDLLSSNVPPPVSSPPVAVSEPVVIELRSVSVQSVVALCQEVMPKSVKIVAMSRSNSVLVINANSDDVKKLDRLLKLVDTLGLDKSISEIVLPRPAISRGPVLTEPPPANDSNRLLPQPQVSTPGNTRVAPPLPTPAQRP